MTAYGWSLGTLFCLFQLHRNGDEIDRSQSLVSRSKEHCTVAGLECALIPVAALSPSLSTRGGQTGSCLCCTHFLAFADCTSRCESKLFCSLSGEHGRPDYHSQTATQSAEAGPIMHGAKGKKFQLIIPDGPISRAKSRYGKPSTCATSLRATATFSTSSV